MIELVLNVTHEMRLCKTKFWKAMEINPVCDPEHVSLAAAKQLTKEKKLEAWWERPGFKEWFAAEDEYEVNLESAKYDALDTLLEVMKNPDSPASARVAAAKQVMDQVDRASKTDEGLEKMLEKIAGTTDLGQLRKLAE